MIRMLMPLLAVVFSTTSAFAADLLSAKRVPGTSYLEYVPATKILKKYSQDDQQPPTATDPYSLSKPYKQQSDLPKTTEWATAEEMNTNFARLRDRRWLTTEDHPGFLRRSSWLYPDDGCFARASLAVMNLIQWKVSAPGKIFVFGDLTVKTANSSAGQVSWWFHVAPIVEIAGEKYVLDPAIEPKHPLALEKWLATMSEDIGKLNVAICHSGTYSPYDNCNSDSDGIEEGANRDQENYLSAEWFRLEELKRDPNSELGDNPPWLTKGVNLF